MILVGYFGDCSTYTDHYAINSVYNLKVSINESPHRVQVQGPENQGGFGSETILSKLFYRFKE